MKAAVLTEYGAPSCGEFEDPRPGPDSVVVEMAAAGVNHVDLAIASGRFYTGPPSLPCVVGSDGVGCLEDGRKVYFDATVAPYGSMGQFSLVPADRLIGVPEGVSDEVAAALGNAGIAAWLALAWRAELKEGERVLVLGATGAVGRIAVQVAKELGAGTVVAAGRDPNALQRLVELGAEAVVDLSGDDLARTLRSVEPNGFDVIVDLVWGPPSVASLGAASQGARLVQLGHLAAADAFLPAALVRSKGANILGHANFHAPFAARSEAYRKLVRLAAEGSLTVDVERVPLDRVGEAWRRQLAGTRSKLVIGLCDS